MAAEPRAVSVALQKGGVGKTAVSINLAERLAARDNDVLLIDLDQQGNATEGVGLDAAYTETPNLAHVLQDGISPQQVIRQAAGETPFDVLPAHKDFDELEDKVRNATFGALWLQRQVVSELLGDTYDYMVVDSPPSIGPMADMGMVATRNVIIPLLGAEEAVAGMERLVEQQIVPLRRETDVDILAVVPNMTEGTNEERRIIEGLESLDDDNPLAGKLPAFARSDHYDRPDSPGPGIRKRIAIRRAWREGVPLASYDPDADILDRFDALAHVVEQGGITDA